MKGNRAVYISSDKHNELKLTFDLEKSHNWTINTGQHFDLNEEYFIELSVKNMLIEFFVNGRKVKGVEAP